MIIIVLRILKSQKKTLLNLLVNMLFRMKSLAIGKLKILIKMKNGNMKLMESIDV